MKFEVVQKITISKSWEIGRNIQKPEKCGIDISQNMQTTSSANSIQMQLTIFGTRIYLHPVIWLQIAKNFVWIENIDIIPSTVWQSTCRREKAFLSTCYTNIYKNPSVHNADPPFHELATETRETPLGCGQSHSNKCIFRNSNLY